MKEFCICLLVVFIIFFFWNKAETYRGDYGFVAKILDPHEYNRMEFGIESTKQCRNSCSADGRCVAVEHVHDYAGSDKPICVFYDSFSGTIASSLAPGKHVSGIWIKP